MEPTTPAAFPWTRLPLHIQQRILSFAVLPDGPGTPLIVGDRHHSAHLRTVAVPMLLALGSWSGYFNAVRDLYRDVHVDLSVHRRSSLNFLTSYRALRPRGMVVKLRMIVNVKKSLPLFDTGHTIRQSKGKLIKMNIPTALRCMKLHGRLSEVEFLVDSLGDTAEVEKGVPENYLPMAEIQLVGRSILHVLDDKVASSSAGLRPDIGEAETVIAPAFLACRAWQSGFLPLFEDGTFQKGVSLGLILNGHQSDPKGSAGEDSGDSIFRVDGASLMRYWLGGTIVELLDETAQPSSWIDPFTLSTQRPENLDGVASSVASHQSELLPRRIAVVDSIENDNDIAASPDKATDSPVESAWKSRRAESEEPLSVLNQQRRPDNAQMGCSISHDAPGPSKSYNTPSEGESMSDEVEMRTLHRRFGVGSRVRENMSSPSRSRSSSPARSVLIATISSGMASPTSSSDLEACWLSSRRSVSLGEDHHINSIAAYLTGDSSESDQREEEAQQPPVQDVRTPQEDLSSEKHAAYTNNVLNGVESAMDAGKCATSNPVEEHAKLSGSSKKAAKKTRKRETRRKKREAKSRAQGDDANTGHDVHSICHAPDRTILPTEPKKQTPGSRPAAQEMESQSNKASHPCSASTEMLSGRSGEVATEVAAKAHSSKKGRGRSSQDDQVERSQGSSHSRRRARKAKDQQLELLERLEAEAWERERTLVK